MNSIEELEAQLAESPSAPAIIDDDATVLAICVKLGTWIILEAARVYAESPNKTNQVFFTIRKYNNRMCLIARYAGFPDAIDNGWMATITPADWSDEHAVKWLASLIDGVDPDHKLVFEEVDLRRDADEQRH